MNKIFSKFVAGFVLGGKASQNKPAGDIFGADTKHLFPLTGLVVAGGSSSYKVSKK